MTTDKEAQHSLVRKSAFGAILAHDYTDGYMSRLGLIMASVPATPEEHQLILNRLPRLAVMQGLNPDNAQRLLDLAAAEDYDPNKAWIQANQPEQEV